MIMTDVTDQRGEDHASSWLRGPHDYQIGCNDATTTGDKGLWELRWLLADDTAGCFEGTVHDGKAVVGTGDGLD